MLVFWQKWLYSDNVFVFREMWLTSYKVVYSGKVDFFRAKMFLILQIGCFREKVVVFGQSCYFRQSGCIRLKEVLFGENLLYSGKCSCIRSKVVVFEQSGCF